MLCSSGTPNAEVITVAKGKREAISVSKEQYDLTSSSEEEDDDSLKGDSTSIVEHSSTVRHLHDPHLLKLWRFIDP